MTAWYAVATLLQCGHVVAAHVVPAVGNAAGILGVGIPLVVGVLWAKGAPPESAGAAVTRGFALGFLPALIGLALALALGQVAPLLLIAGSASSGVTGLIGALVGRRLAD